MPRVHSIPRKNNLVLDTFQQSVKMSTYLVAFAVGEYKGKSKLTKSGVNVSKFITCTCISEDKVLNLKYAKLILFTNKLRIRI